MDRRAGGILVGVIGVCVVLVYLGTSLGIIRGGGNVLLAAVFAIGPAGIAGTLGVRRRLGPPGDPVTLLGTVLLVVAFSLLTLMIVVQQSVRMQFQDLLASTADQATRDILAMVSRGVDFVQLGMDVAFDVFYCLGIVVLSLAMFRTPRFGRMLGGFGVASAGALLVANLATFPYVPREAGFVDLGPVTGVWWIAVVLRLMRHQPKD